LAIQDGVEPPLVDDTGAVVTAFAVGELFSPPNMSG
jgi:hypothetical protein